MKDILNKNKKIIIATLSGILFLLILRDIYRYEITSYDNFAYNLFVENLRSEKMTVFMKFITSFGSGLVLITIVILMILLYKNKNTLWRILIWRNALMAKDYEKYSKDELINHIYIKCHQGMTLVVQHYLKKEEYINLNTQTKPLKILLQY